MLPSIFSIIAKRRSFFHRYSSNTPFLESSWFLCFLYCSSKMNINIKIDFKLALSADPPPRHLLLRWVSWSHSSLSSKFSLFVFFLFFLSWTQYPTMSQSSQHQSEPLESLIQLMSFTQLSRWFSFPNVFKARQQPSFHFLPSKLWGPFSDCPRGFNNHPCRHKALLSC